MLSVNELQEMPHKELKQLHDNVGLALISVRERERGEVRAKLEQVAKQAGFTIKDLMGGKAQAFVATASKQRRKQRSGPKYVNPANSDDTWTGRGRRPRWLAAKLKAGKSIEQFLSN